MAKDLFYSLDLNLLRTFLVLTQELNMRKASDRLHVSQPAISQALQKLRNHFEDELFVKVRNGLEPTPYAESLANSITPHLDGLANALNDSQEFDPTKFSETLKIALNPSVLVCLSGVLFNAIKELAPNASIELVSWSSTTSEDIRKGTIFMGINYDFDYSKDIYRTFITNLVGRAIVRNEHPISSTFAELNEFSGFDIASVVIPGYNDRHSLAVDVLRERGVDTKVGFRSEMVLAILDVVEHTDMIMPNTDLFPVHRYPQLRAIDFYIDGKSYKYPLYSFCHIRNRSGSLFQWLNSLIISLLEEQKQVIAKP